MQSAEIMELRHEYFSLRIIADGLADIVNAGAACNLLTMARMAQEARDALHKLASEIEKLMRSPVQKTLDLLKEAKEWMVKKLPGMCSLVSSLTLAFR